MLKLGTVEQALKDLKSGQMIVLVDDEDRENEGDLVLAAEHASAENINFMLSHGKGLICVTMSERRLKKFGFPYQVQHNTSPFGTNFAVSFDLKKKISSGNSASSRAQGIKHLTSADASAKDFVMPGHVFPLGAVSGGVLKRRGQTEGSYDLCKLANLDTVGVICEIMDNSGKMLSGKALQDYCSSYDFTLISIEQLVEYKLKHQISIRRIKELKFDSDSTLYVYIDDSTLKQHYALLIAGSTSEVRTLTQDVVQDVFFETIDNDSRVGTTIKELKELGGGVLVYLREENLSLSEQIVRDLNALI